VAMPPSPSDHLEVEWQFDAESLEPVIDWLAVAKVPGYTVTPAKTKELRDTYYDTADWRLHRGGFTCRVRHGSDGDELTLKSMAAAVDGLRSRREMNEPLPSGVRPEAAPGECGRSIRLVAGRRLLEALFTLHQVRRTFLLADDEGHLAEIAVDQTAVEGTPDVLRRIELEVVPEGIARVERFRRLLVDVGGLVPGTLSKFEFAMRSAGAVAVPTEATLGSTAVSADMTVGDVAFAILRKHFAVFLANEPGTRLGDDIEALHDMRVAARRLRAAMQAFRPWLPLRAQRFREELGYLARSLGEVRDLDVFIETLESWEHDDPEHREALLAIGTVLNERRNAARGRMLTVLDRRRYDLFVERFAAFLRRGSLPNFAAGLVPVREVAPGLLSKRYRTVRKMGDAIGPASPPDSYHALRIEGKKLRYALEFFTPVYGQPAGDFAKRLAALQDVLGLHQDAYVAIDTLTDLANTSARRLGPQTLLAMGAVQERYRNEAENLRGRFREVYKPMAAQWKVLEKTF
jgi:triphosphatase